MSQLRVGVMAPGLDHDAMDFVRQSEALGVDSVWTPVAWMYDALTPIGYLAAITERVRLATGVVQLGARSPALLAMSALALQKMSDDRFVLGLGTSGPQVMEGWHGVRFAAMGSASTNFYNRAFAHQCFGDAVNEVQGLWQSGDREVAADAVPIELGLRTNLLGGDAEVTDRLRAYRAAGIQTLRVSVHANDPTARLDSLARLMDLVENVNNNQPA